MEPSQTPNTKEDLEAKRREMRRRKILAASASRLDTICGIPNKTVPQNTNLDKETKVEPTVAQSNKIIQTSTLPNQSSVPASHSHEQHENTTESHQKEPIVQKIDENRTQSQTRIQTENRISESTNLKNDVNTAQTKIFKPHIPENAMQSNQLFNKSALEESSSSSSFTMTLRTRLLIGSLFSLLIGVLTHLLPDYGTILLTLFIVIELAMWGRVEKNKNEKSGALNALFGAFFPQNQQTGSNFIAKGFTLYNAYSSFKHAINDYFILLFFHIVLLHLMPLGFKLESNLQ